MKSTLCRMLVLASLCVGFTGCISIPPLITVNHQETESKLKSSDQVVDRLEKIERRLDRIEEKMK